MAIRLAEGAAPMAQGIEADPCRDKELTRLGTSLAQTHRHSTRAVAVMGNNYQLWPTS